MSDINLPPEAVEAGARAAFEFAESQFTRPKTWDELHPRVREAWRDSAHITLAAAGPIIAAEARERVAREIEARVKGEALLPDEPTTGRTIRTLREDGFTEAARIARGEES